MKKNWSKLLIPAVILALFVTNGFLVWQNLQLKSEVEKAKLTVTEEGYRFSRIRASDLTEKEENIDLADGEHKTLLLVFRSTCDYCRQQYPAWKDLNSKIDHAKWRVILVTPEKKYEDIKTHVKNNQLDDLRVLSIDAEDARNARLVFTPMTIVVDEKGEVEKVWTGLWKSRDLASIFEFFDVGRTG
jgi:peroxiredoxin